MPRGTILFGKENALVNNVYVLQGQASEGDIETDDGYDSSDSSQGRKLLTILILGSKDIFWTNQSYLQGPIVQTSMVCS